MSTWQIRSLLPTIQVNRTQKGPLAREPPGLALQHGGDTEEQRARLRLTRLALLLPQSQWGFDMIQLQNHMITGTPRFILHLIKNVKVLKLNSIKCHIREKTKVKMYLLCCMSIFRLNKIVLKLNVLTRYLGFSSLSRE